MQREHDCHTLQASPDDFAGGLCWLGVSGGLAPVPTNLSLPGVASQAALSIQACDLQSGMVLLSVRVLGRPLEHLHGN